MTASPSEPSSNNEVATGVPGPPHASPPPPPPAATSSATPPLEPWQMVPVDPSGHQFIPTDVLLPLLERLPENVQATTCRLLCKAMREHFQHKLTVRLDTAALRAARQREVVGRSQQISMRRNAAAAAAACANGHGTARPPSVAAESGDAEEPGADSSGVFELWGGVPPHAVEWFLTHTSPAERPHMTLEQRCDLRDAVLSGQRARAPQQLRQPQEPTQQQQQQEEEAVGYGAAATTTVVRGPRQADAAGPEEAVNSKGGLSLAADSRTPESTAAVTAALVAQGALFWRRRPGARFNTQAVAAASAASSCVDLGMEDDADADSVPSPVLHYPSYSLGRMLAAVPPQPHGLRHAGGDGAAVLTSDRLSALRELTLAAALYGDTDMLTVLARVPGVHEVRHQLTADCAWWAVRGYLPMELLAWAVREPDGPLGSWRSSDAPFLAAALSLRQRAAGGGGDSDGDDLEGPGAAEELRRALGRLHAAGFGSFHAAGRTFLAAVDLAARGKVAAELVCWLLDCGCPTGPPGWSYVAAVRPLIDGPASAAVSERCLGLAARLARRRVPLSAAALSGISGLPYDVFCSYVSLLVREYGCPLDRTALYGEVTASLRKASPNKHTPGPPPPQQQLPLQHLHAQQSGQPARMPLEDQQRKLAWLTDQRLAPTRLERWAPGRLLARTRERLRSLVGADGRGRGASAAAGGRSHSSQASGCVASAGGDARNWGAGAASAGVGGGVAFIETAAVAAAAGGKIGIGVAAREGGGPVPGPGASKSRGRAAAPSTLNRVEELLSGLPQNLGVGGGAVGLAASGRASATSELEEVFDTRASSVMAWDLQVA